MCYEERFFTTWTRAKTKKQEETESRIEQTRGAAAPVEQKPEREATRPKETEREVEEIV